MILEHSLATFHVDGISKFGGVCHPCKFNGKPKFGRLKYIFHSTGNRACLVYALPLYFLTLPASETRTGHLLFVKHAIHHFENKTFTICWIRSSEIDLVARNWPIVGGTLGVALIQQVERVRMIRTVPQRTRTWISAHFHRATRAARRSISNVTESGLDFDGKRGRPTFDWVSLLFLASN